jgi:hypothetical protein
LSENGYRQRETRSRKQRDNGGIASAVQKALEQFAALTRMEPVATTGVRREDHGWSVLIDVVELERVPSTTSVMATYRVDLDGDGEVVGYERLRRFNRGSVDS